MEKKKRTNLLNRDKKEYIFSYTILCVLGWSLLYTFITAFKSRDFSLKFIDSKDFLNDLIINILFASGVGVYTAILSWKKSHRGDD